MAVIKIVLLIATGPISSPQISSRPPKLPDLGGHEHVTSKITYKSVIRLDAGGNYKSFSSQIRQLFEPVTKAIYCPSIQKHNGYSKNMKFDA